VYGEEAQAALAVVGRACQAPEFGREIQGIPNEKAVSYVVPIGDPSRSQVDVLVLQPHRPFLPVEVLLFGSLGILCGALAVSLFFVGHRLSNRDNELETRRALLRGLQVGLVRLDNHGMILEGNDRAEEILGVELPMTDPVAGSAWLWMRLAGGRLPSPEAPVRRRLQEFIEEDQVIERSEDPPGAELTTFQRVLERLGRGRRSLTYVRKKSQPQWLRVLSTPILGAARSSIASGMFATFDVVNPMESAAVEGCYQQLCIERGMDAPPAPNARGEGEQI
jgi:PAS domain-containing protein